MSEISKAVKDGRHFLTQFRSLVEFVKVLESYEAIEQEVMDLRQECGQLQKQRDKLETAVGKRKADLHEADQAVKAAQIAGEKEVKEAQLKAAAFIDKAHQQMAEEGAAHQKAVDELKEKRAALEKQIAEETQRLDKQLEAANAELTAVKAELRRIKDKIS